MFRSSLLVKVTAAGLRPTLPFDVAGTLPAGPLILCSKHERLLDPVYLGLFLQTKRRHGYFAMSPAIRPRWLMELLGGVIFWRAQDCRVRACGRRQTRRKLLQAGRHSNDRALQRLVAALVAGQVAVVFPEATRLPGEWFDDFKIQDSSLCARLLTECRTQNLSPKIVTVAVDYSPARPVIRLGPADQVKSPDQLSNLLNRTLPTLAGVQRRGHRFSYHFADDGTRLFVRHFRPSDSPKAVLLALHGYFEHSGSFVPLLEDLTKLGIECMALDLRGHGHSGGARGDCPPKRALDDIRALLARLPEVPLFILGHSFGGMLALQLATLDSPVHNLSGVVVTNPFLAPRWTVAKRVLSLLSRILPGRIAIPAPIRLTDLSPSPEVQRAFLRDPLRFWSIRLGWFRHILRCQRMLYRSILRQLPMLFITSSGDPVVDANTTMGFIQNNAHSELRAIEVGFCFHEVLWGTEELRRLFMDRLREWLNIQLRDSDANA